MKKEYIAPDFDVDSFELSQSIASQCGFVLTLGLWDPSLHPEHCEDYYDNIDEPYPWEQRVNTFSLPHNIVFWNDESGACDCYYSASSSGYFAS